MIIRQKFRSGGLFRPILACSGDGHPTGACLAQRGHCMTSQILGHTAMPAELLIDVMLEHRDSKLNLAS